MKVAEKNKLLSNFSLTDIHVQMFKLCKVSLSGGHLQRKGPFQRFHLGQHLVLLEFCGSTLHEDMNCRSLAWVQDKFGHCVNPYVEEVQKRSRTPQSGSGLSLTGKSTELNHKMKDNVIQNKLGHSSSPYVGEVGPNVWSGTYLLMAAKNGSRYFLKQTLLSQ